MLYQLSVPQIHCSKCVERIQHALDETGIAFFVSLETKTVTVDGCEHCLQTAIQALDDLGFDATVQ